MDVTGGKIGFMFIEAVVEILWKKREKNTVSVGGGSRVKKPSLLDTEMAKLHKSTLIPKINRSFWPLLFTVLSKRACFPWPDLQIRSFDHRRGFSHAVAAKSASLFSYSRTDHTHPHPTHTHPHTHTHTHTHRGRLIHKNLLCVGSHPCIRRAARQLSTCQAKRD